MPPFDAVLFDLDGVLADTAEYHFRAWKRLADELGIPFTRADNERLRGVARRASLDLILELGQRAVPEEQAQTLMARKNTYYRQLLDTLTPDDLLPGVEALLLELRAAGIKIVIASASQNSPQVVERLGIRPYIDLLAHGGHVPRQKPHPDLFLYAARQLHLPPARCLVVEDAAAGIQAAHAAGMPAVGIGPAERVGQAEVVLPSLQNATLAKLARAAAWRVSEPAFEPEKQHHRETIFTIGNGYLGTRGSFEERFPEDRQATLIHGIYDHRPIVFTELANAPDWTAFEIWVNGQRFSMHSSQISDYARWLDLRDATLHRRLRWTPDADTGPVEITFSRFASLADEHVLALRVAVTPLEAAARVRLRAKLDGHVENQGLLHWHTLSQHSSAAEAALLVRTRQSGKRVAMCTRLHLSPDRARLTPSDCTASPGIQAELQLAAGEQAVCDKFVAVFTSRDTADPLAAARSKAASAAQAGFEALQRAHKAAWKAFWDTGDVKIEGDHEAQLALRHGLLQLRIAAPTHDDRVSIPAKTLSGFAYAGHVFWDNEIFVLPFFTFTQPELARNMLRYRYHTLPGARRKARKNGLPGAQFPWESAETGDEVTPTWVPHFDDPTRLVRIWTGDIQLHITADVAYAMHQYWRATGDEAFWREVGVPVLLETAVFWGARAEPEGDRFSIRDVIGCDEYHEHVDNNAYTNALVRWHLQTALEALDWLWAHDPPRAGELTERLQLTPERLAHWRRVIDNLVFLHDPESGLIEQFEGFFDLKEVDWSRYEGRTRSMQVLLGIEGANAHQVLKQPDVIALLCLLGEQFDRKTWRANWDYYVPRTDHTYGSSLGPAMHAWAAARMGQPEEAYRHFLRAARADLADVRGNAGEGIHAASAGGMWQAVVFGFAGLRLTEDGPQIDPCLPPHWQRLTFDILYRGERHHFDLRREGGEKDQT